MVQVNENYLKLKASYLFPEIARRVKEYEQAHPRARIIRLGIGDVTEPLPHACVEAMRKAVDEMGERATFRGYGPEQGYDFLREAIAEHDFQKRGADIHPDEIFVSDGSKCDTGNILDIFGRQNVIAVQDPVYPVYVDTNVMAGHTGPANENGEYEGLVYLQATAENNFSPPLPDRPVDIIYLCYPNNPTGAVAARPILAKWIDYARENSAILFFDAAYEAYITDPSVPHSIYEIPGARDVAIEFRSFSKTAGFTGTRCAYTVVPRSLKGNTADGAEVDLHRLWLRRQTTKFNGVSYIVQRGAAAVYTPEGLEETQKLVSYYLDNARTIRRTLYRTGAAVYGGANAPYVWVKTPGNASSRDFVEKLLEEAQVVVTPGSGFGAAGEGYIRISAFNSHENVQEALERMTPLFQQSD